MKSKLSLLLLAVAVLSGCGTKFNLESVPLVKVGMTKAEVEQIVGPPAQKVRGRLDGLETWMWSYDNGIRRNSASIVFDGDKVIQVPGGLAKTRAALEEQNRTAGAELDQYRADKLEAELTARREARKAQEMKRLAEESARRTDYIAANPSRPAKILECVRRRQVCPGMTAEELELSWGRPESKNKSGGTFGLHEQWVYGLGRYVYLQNGTVTSWQVSE